MPKYQTRIWSKGNNQKHLDGEAFYKTAGLNSLKYQWHENKGRETLLDHSGVGGGHDHNTQGLILKWILDHTHTKS